MKKQIFNPKKIKIDIQGADIPLVKLSFSKKDGRGRPRDELSAEEILLGIFYAKKEVARTRPKRPEEGTDILLEDIDSGKLNTFDIFYIESGSSKPSEEYLSARKILSRWNSRARRFCNRRDKDLESFPIECGESEK